MKNVKRKVAVLLAIVLMMSSMPVAAASNVSSNSVDETAKGTEMSTVSGQMGNGLSISADEIVEALYSNITEDDIRAIMDKAEEAFMDAASSADADEPEFLLSLIEEEVKVYLEDVLEKAKAEYADLEKEDVYQAVYSGMLEKVMDAVKGLFDLDDSSLMSLQPLVEEEISVDLTGLTPVELTKVPFSKIFAGKNMTGVKQIAYVYHSSSYSDNYVIGSYPGDANLSRGSYSSYNNPWLMIPSGDQLNGNAIRYIVEATNTVSREWFVPTVYLQDDAGKRTAVSVSEFYYSDGSSDGDRYMTIYVPGDKVSYDQPLYLKFDLNSSLYGDSENRAQIKVYEGKYETAEAATAGKEITDKIYGNVNMARKDAGYVAYPYTSKWITVVSFNANGKATGCLPFYFNIHGRGESSSLNSSSHMPGFMFERMGSDGSYVSSSVSYNSSRMVSENNLVTLTYKLYEEYAANDTYYMTMSYFPKGISGSNNQAVTAAYVGQYESIAAAQKAGAEDIKETLFGGSSTAGYKADYSKGVYFSIFVGTDGVGQEAYHYCIKAEESSIPKGSSSVGVTFIGLRDKGGNPVDCYIVKPKDDSYAEGSYPTIMVAGDVDLTSLAPEFTTSTGVNLYAAGSKKPEKSGEDCHDFSKGPVHYTTASENGKNQKNVWLTVKKEGTAGTSYNLYTNSLADSESNTKVEGGVIYSKREVILQNSNDGHDIFLINMGSNVIPKLSVELTSDVLEIDEYWTLNGNHDLSAFAGIEDTTRYGELANMAKVRLKMKDGVISGTEVEGTLTIKANGKAVMVLELTGIAGAPIITTDSIPEAVKYVPYGTMIQNSNKYSKTKIVYVFGGGTLPDGMELRENGELYGVPKEMGTFGFWVRMISQNPYASMEKYFTLVVKENTDENVDGSTDPGYDVTQRIPTVAINSAGSHAFVSQGILDEFVDVYLDGEKLVKNVDYSAESGSTRLTISSQTLTRANEVGTHTLGVEFRTPDENALKKAAQNFNVVSEGTIIDNGGSGNSGSGSGSSDGGESSESGSASTANTTATVRETAAGEAEVEVIVYTVMPGDTLAKIAAKYYGSASMWRKIYEDNRDILSNPNRIRVGQMLKIYLTKTAQGAGTAGALARIYTIRKGDSLWKIAKTVYGKGWQWRKIYDANRNVISDSKLIRTGQDIMIP